MDDARRDTLTRYLDEIRAALTRTPHAAAWLALSNLQTEYEEMMQDEADRAFGHGWREGHRVGHSQGWKQRDDVAQAEILAERAKTHAAHTHLEAARAELADPIGAYQADVEGRLRRRKRQPRAQGVH